MPYGDFMNRNHKLEKQGYIEQYWLQEVKKAGGKEGLFVDFAFGSQVSIRSTIASRPLSSLPVSTQ